MQFITALWMMITALLSLILASVVIVEYLVLCPGPSSNASPLEWWIPLGIVISIGINWFLARLQQNMYVINGSGTKLFGRTPSENGYIATKWLSMFFFPVLPVASYEILAKQEEGLTERFAWRPLDDLDWPQVMGTWLKGAAAFLAILLAFLVLVNLTCFL